MKKSDLVMISINLPFKSIYFWFSINFHIEFTRNTVLLYWEETTPCTEVPHGYCPPCTSNPRVYYPCVLPSYGVSICGCSSISCLTELHIPLLLSEKRLLSFLIITLFDTFLEILGSYSFQHTLVVKSWGGVLVLSWIQRTICNGHWFCLSVHMYLY